MVAQNGQRLDPTPPPRNVNPHKDLVRLVDHSRLARIVEPLPLLP